MTEYIFLEEARRRRTEAEKAETEKALRENSALAQAEICRLASLDKFTYQRERIDAAKKLGVTRSFLDHQVKAEQKARQAGSDELPEIDPWPDPVDGAELLDELKAMIKRHIAVPTRAEEAIALWILHAHCFDAANITPRLAITSPTPECGKSTLLRLIGGLVPRRLIASNITSAATFRAIEQWSPTLIIDEADTFLGNNDELRGVLNSGHSRAEAFVVRTVGDEHEPRRFSTWCPVVIALIGKLSATLESRAIHIELQRLGAGEHIEPYRHYKAPYADLARRAARWAVDHVEELGDAEPDMEGIANRRADNWRPLFAIADRVGGHWPNLAREAAFTLNHVDAGQTTALMLLEDMRSLIGEMPAISSETLAKQLGGMEGSRWPEYKNSKPITKHAIARLLRPFNVFPQDIRDPETGESCKGYRTVDLVGVFKRYLPS